MSRPKIKKVDELRSKCRFLDWLIKRTSGKNYALASEYRFSEHKRYADILRITPTSTTAYEIKSKSDKTTRLEGQLECYLKTFEFTYVVCHIKHLQKILNSLPLHVGLIVEDATYKVFKKASRSPFVSAESVVATSNKFFLKSLFSQKTKFPVPIQELRQFAAQNIPLKILKRRSALDLYKRYKPLTEVFLKERYPGKTTPDDLFTISTDRPNSPRLL